MGSGAGVNQILARTVDFGATDKPLDMASLAAGHLYQFPSVMGAIVIIAHLPGVDVSRLRLDGPHLAGIFDGSILDWDDPRIKRLNPDMNFPETSVAPLHRADASGTSFVFTSYLSKVSPSWKRGLAPGLPSRGPVARGQGGMTVWRRVSVRRMAASFMSNMPMQNKSSAGDRPRQSHGAFIKPDMASFEAAHVRHHGSAPRGMSLICLIQVGQMGGRL